MIFTQHQESTRWWPKLLLALRKSFCRIEEQGMIPQQENRQYERQIRALSRPYGRILGMVALVAFSVSAVAAPPETITSLAALHSLTNDEAGKSLPATFEATVTYHINGRSGLFLQERGLAVYGDAPEDAKLAVGDRVLVHGKTGAGFRPYIRAESVTVIGDGAIPAPVAASYMMLVRSDLDCVRVKVRGKVRSADLVTYGNVINIYLELSIDGGPVSAIVNSIDGSILKTLRGAEVEVAGSASAIFDSKKQLTGAILKVPSLSDVKILEEAHSNADALPVTPMGSIFEHSYIRDLSARVRVEGTITYYIPGAAAVLQNGVNSLWIETKDQQPLNIGDRATALGYPALRNGVLTLINSEVEDSHQRSPIVSQRTGWDELNAGANAFNLISIDAQVVSESREQYQDKYLLTAEGNLFSVVYRHIDENLGFALPPMKHIPVGSTVRVTGITSSSYGSNPFEGPTNSDVLLRSFDDIEVVAKPSWLNVHNLIQLVGILLAVIFIIGIRVVWTERKARLYNATIARLERKRGEILEDINTAQPLAKILNNINELASERLGGARCWIQVTDSPPLGNSRAQNSGAGLRVVEELIPARSGPALGVICAAFDADTKPLAVETESLIQAAGLARLALETSRLYSDLVHRSEFDQLTGIYNRFSLENQMGVAIDTARQSDGIFGLLYIDLNDFKQINDQLGHHAGDLYLKQVVLRMKHQIRPCDTLARLGGDEFAVILPNVRCHADIEEIMLRLERGFEEPFTLEGFTLNGTASIGSAIFPADGTNCDSLLRTADAAMYVAKQAKPQNEGKSSGCCYKKGPPEERSSLIGSSTAGWLRA
jgi:diguanylate cyclase (GGDEF)-like protein